MVDWNNTAKILCKIRVKPPGKTFLKSLGQFTHRAGSLLMAVVLAMALSVGFAPMAYATQTASADTDPEIEVTFNYNYEGANPAEDVILVDPDTGLVTMPEDPERDGYVFMGWYLDADGESGAFDPETPVSESIEVFAIWLDDPTITTTSLPNGTVGVEYSAILTAASNTDVAWTLEAGDLPDGLELDKDGTITGKPTAAGKFDFTVQAANDSGSDTKGLSITVDPVPVDSVALDETELSMVVGDEAVKLTATVLPANATNKEVTWSSSDEGVATVVDGLVTAMSSGTATITVTAADGSGRADECVVTVSTAPSITTTSLPDGTAGAPYGETLEATGDETITWALVEGVLPDGLELSEDGVISGTPTSADTYGFTVMAKNGAGSDTKGLSITVDPVPVSLNQTELILTVGDNATLVETITPDTAAYDKITWSSSDEDVATVVDGEVTAISAGTATITVTVTVGDVDFTADCKVTVNPVAPVAPTITTESLPNGMVGTAYNAALSADGDDPIYWALEAGSDLPAGLTLSAGGAITGTPTAAATTDFTVVATNAAGSDLQPLSITIDRAPVVGTSPTITTGTLAGGKVGTAYSATLAATGTGPIAWTLDSGRLPVGLTLSSNGTIAGTPTAAGTFSFTVQAANDFGSATRAYTITVAAVTLPATAAPVIATQPVSAHYYQNQSAQALRVSASAGDKGTLSYQWYSNTANSTAGAKVVMGATASSYTPSTAQAGTVYYFCKVTNTKAGSTPGAKAVNSRVAMISTSADFNRQVVTFGPVAGAILRADVLGASTDAGTQVALWVNNGDANQRYYLVRGSDGYYTIKSVNSNLVLDASGAQARVGTPIIQWPDLKQSNQRWMPVIQKDGSYKLVSAMDPSLCIGLAQGTTSGSALVLARVSATNTSQNFRFDVIKDTLGTGQIFTIKNVNSKLNLDINGASTQNGAAAITWNINNNKNQQFKLTYVPTTGYYTLTAMNSGKLVDVTSVKLWTAGTEVIQWPGNGGLNQQWNLRKDTAGHYQIATAVGGQVLDASGASKAPGTPVIVWPAKVTDNANQLWILTGVKA